MYGRVDNNPLSEQFRLAGKDWSEKESAAQMLEQSKTAVLSQRMNALGDMPTTKAERLVKATPEWREYISEMVKAREAANFAKVNKEFVKMKYHEWQSMNASRRAEMRMGQVMTIHDLRREYETQRLKVINSIDLEDIRKARMKRDRIDRQIKEIESSGVLA